MLACLSLLSNKKDILVHLQYLIQIINYIPKNMHKTLSSKSHHYHDHHTAHNMCGAQKCMWLFTGVLCEENIDECNALPCLHNATCIDDIASYSCHCSEGYSGRLCEVEPFDACMSEPCHNDATCIFTGLNYRWGRGIPVYDLLHKPGISHFSFFLHYQIYCYLHCSPVVKNMLCKLGNWWSIAGVFKLCSAELWFLIGDFKGSVTTFIS